MRCAITFGATGLLLLVAVAGMAQTTDPETRVAQFHQRLLETMQSGSDFPGRFEILAAPVADFFDIATVSRISLGRTWRTLDADSQAQFSALLQHLIVATYADRFDSFDGQSFHTLSTEPASRGWVVRTELERANGERVSLDYYFREDGVFNVVADGVSDLSVRRADYNSIVKSEGYAALLERMRDNIAELSKLDELSP